MARDLENKRRWYHQNKSKYVEQHREYNRNRYWSKKDTISKKAKVRYKRLASVIRERNLQSYYGINISDFNAMLEKQNYRCAICEVKQEVLTSVLHVDHDHITKKIRGLLCSNCNFGLGQFKDSPELLRKAITYLQVLQ